MLDLACIFTTGGVILFYKTFCELNISTINEIIFKIFIQEKHNQKSYSQKDRTFIWKYDTEIDVIFLFAYQEVFKNIDFSEMLNYIKSHYKKNVYPNIHRKEDLIIYSPDFTDEFDKLYKAFNKRDNRESGNAKPRTIQEKIPEKDSEIKPIENPVAEKDSDESEKNNKSEPKSNLKGEDSRNDSPKKVSFENGVKEDAKLERNQSAPEVKLTAKEKLELNLQRKREKQKNKDEKSSSKNSTESDKIPWNYNETRNSKDPKALDFSKKFEEDGDQLNALKSTYFDDDEKIELDFDMVSSDDEKEPDLKIKKSSILANFKNSLKSFTGSMILDEDNLRNPLEDFKNELLSKNVAQDV